ncbi:hypothetical protein SESBI_33066 [Sesbania bispinosa]|nr:hypothetical protein SESBI_33066 [Sesbania bispinosa]
MTRGRSGRNTSGVQIEQIVDEDNLLSSDSDKDSYVSKELRSLCSSYDDGDTARTIRYPEFNEKAQFGDVTTIKKSINSAT